MWKITQEVKVPVGKATIRCESDWTEYYWENYADHFTFRSPTVGVTLEIEFPTRTSTSSACHFKKKWTAIRSNKTIPDPD